MIRRTVTTAAAWTRKRLNCSFEVMLCKHKYVCTYMDTYVYIPVYIYMARDAQFYQERGGC